MENEFFNNESILAEYSDTLGTGNFLDLGEDNDNTRVLMGILGVTIFLFAFIGIGLFYFVQQNISERDVAVNGFEDIIEESESEVLMVKLPAPKKFDSLAMNE